MNDSRAFIKSFQTPSELEMDNPIELSLLRETLEILRLLITNPRRLDIYINSKFQENTSIQKLSFSGRIGELNSILFCGYILLPLLILIPIVIILITIMMNSPNLLENRMIIITAIYSSVFGISTGIAFATAVSVSIGIMISIMSMLMASCATGLLNQCYINGVLGVGINLLVSIIIGTTFSISIRINSRWNSGVIKIQNKLKNIYAIIRSLTLCIASIIVPIYFIYFGLENLDYFSGIKSGLSFGLIGLFAYILIFGVKKYIWIYGFLISCFSGLSIGIIFGQNSDIPLIEVLVEYGGLLGGSLLGFFLALFTGLEIGYLISLSYLKAAKYSEAKSGSLSSLIFTALLWFVILKGSYNLDDFIHISAVIVGVLLGYNYLSIYLFLTKNVPKHKITQ